MPRRFKKSNRGSRVPRQVNSITGADRTVTLTGKYLWDISTSGGAQISNLPISPRFFDTRLNSLQANWAEFRFVDIKIKFHGATIDSTPSDYIFAYFKEVGALPSPTPESLYQAFKSLYYDRTQTVTRQLRLSRGDLLHSIRPWWICNNDGVDGTTPDFIQGQMIFFTTVAPTTSAKVLIEISYAIQFRGAHDPTADESLVIAGPVVTPKTQQILRRRI